MSRRTIVESDLSGTEFAADADGGSVKITVNGKSGTRDLTSAETDAFTAWVTADAESLPAAREALRALLAPVAAPAAVPARKRSASGSAAGSKAADPRNAAIREWAATPAGRTALGIPADKKLSTRGRLPAGWETAYDAAHAAPAANAA